MSAREKFAKAAQTVLGRTRKSLQINTSHSASTSSRPFFEASPILPRLYLSGLKTAINVGELDRLKVTHIVTVMERPVTYFSESQSIKRRTLLHISIADAGSEDLLQHLDCTTSFIQNALNSEDSVVLVHCAMGISRSPSVVAAYLISLAAKENKPLNALDAIAAVRNKRDVVCPNLEFIRQLEEYASRCLSDSSRGSSSRRTESIAPIPQTEMS